MPLIDLRFICVGFLFALVSYFANGSYHTPHLSTWIHRRTSFIQSDKIQQHNAQKSPVHQLYLPKRYGNLVPVNDVEAPVWLIMHDDWTSVEPSAFSALFEKQNELQNMLFIHKAAEVNQNSVALTSSSPDFPVGIIQSSLQNLSYHQEYQQQGRLNTEKKAARLAVSFDQSSNPDELLAFARDSGRALRKARRDGIAMVVLSQPLSRAADLEDALSHHSGGDRERQVKKLFAQQDTKMFIWLSFVCKLAGRSEGHVASPLAYIFEDHVPAQT